MHPTFAVAVAVALGALSLCGTGCGDDSPPATDDTGTTGTTGGTTGSSGSSGGQTSMGPTPTPPDDDTFGPGCGPDPCGPCDPGCEVYSLCIMSEWTCECICEETEGTGGADPCDSLDAALDAWLETSVNPPIDCGHAGLADDAATWQGVHDCVAGAAMGQAFRASWELLPAPDPEVHTIGAAMRFTDALETVWYEVSGTLAITESSCAQISAVPDCTPAPGEMCIQCEDQLVGEMICADP